MSSSFKELILQLRKQYFENLKYTNPGKIPVVVINKSKEEINFSNIMCVNQTVGAAERQSHESDSGHSQEIATGTRAKHLLVFQSETDQNGRYVRKVVPGKKAK